MPFDRLANVTPAAHKAFEHAFERAMELATPHFEDAYELHLEAKSDPEYADTQDFRDLSDLIHWRYRYFDGFAATYRSLLGRYRPPTRAPRHFAPAGALPNSTL